MAEDIIKVWKIKQGDLLPELTGTIMDPKTRKVQNLTGATLEFHMRNQDGDLVIDAPAAIDGDPTLGRFRYSWQAGDTDEVGEFEGEVQATFAGKPLTVPNDSHFTVVITEELG